MQNAECKIKSELFTLGVFYYIRHCEAWNKPWQSPSFNLK